MTTLRQDADAGGVGDVNDTGDVSDVSDVSDVGDADGAMPASPWASASRHPRPATATTITTSVILANGAAASAIPSPERPRETQGQFLQEMRQRIRLSQAALARLLGYSQQTLSLWEHDVHPMTSVARLRLDDVIREAMAHEQTRQQHMQTMDELTRGWEKIRRW